MNKKFIIRRAVCAALALVMIVACLPLSAFAASSDSPTFSSDAANSLMKNTVPAGYDKTTNPYGYDVDRPFAMVEQNELFYLQTTASSVNGKIADVGTAESLLSFISNNNTASDGSLPDLSLSSSIQQLSFIQSVAFDPTGSGRKDYVVYVGVHRTRKQVYAILSNTVTGKQCGTYIINFPLDWIADSDGDFQVNGYETNALFDVVAGDFDNDGKETVIVYVPGTKKSATWVTTDLYQDINNVGSLLWELRYDADGNKLTSNHNNTTTGDGRSLGYDLLHDLYIETYQSGKSVKGARNDSIGGSKQDTLYNAMHKLSVKMVVGDFNGDNIDDLAVLSYFHVNCITSDNKNVYRPQVKIKYGGTMPKEGSFIDQKADESFYVCPEGKLSDGEVQSSSSMNACNITAGDINNDGYDDLVVAGIKAEIEGYGETDESYLAYTTLLNNKNNGFIQSDYKTMSTNEWTYKSTDGEDIVSPLAVEAVAYNGASAADFIFINGTLYTYNTATGELNTVASQGYKMSGFQFDGALGGYEEFIRSVAVGNFDGNNAGREQIVFVTSCRDGDDTYSFKKGLISATYNDTAADYGAATGFKTTLSDWGPNKADGGYKGGGAQVLLTACDRDQDGVIARYKGVSYAYSDPEVKAVMQVAPYFAALGDSANNETDYTITESYELEQSSSKNVSYSVGMSYSYGGLFAPFELEISAGYSLEWSKSFSEALETEYAMTVKAQAYNTALVARTPVFIYCYEVLDENGKWSDETAISLSIPQQPVYQQMSIDDYNSFAEEYNSYMEKKGNRAITKESDKTSKDEACYYPLEQINEEENWLNGNEGNPYMYNQLGWGAYSAIGAQQLSQNTIRLGYAGGLNEVSYSKSNIKSVSEEISHGFYFNFSISFGVFGDGILFSHDVGFETSLSYSNGSGVSTTKTSSQGCIGAVNDIDGPALAEEGIPASIYTQYTFDWTLGQWFRHLYGEEGNKTVFIGYSLSNVSTPAPAVDDLEANLFADDAVHLTWSQPDKTPGWPEVEGYYVYRAENGECTKISDLLPADTTSYEIENLKTNTNFGFAVTSVCKVDGKEKESTWSNIAEVTTAKRDYKVNYSVDNAKAADIKVRHLGNVEIQSGDEISESEIIKVKVTPKSGQYELLSLTLDNGGETMVFTPEKDGTIVCAFTLNGEANMRVSTKRAINSAQITFTDTYTADGTVIGTVSAAVGDVPLNAPGGTVTDNVTFTAVPGKGYGLKSWKITDASGTTETIDTAGSNSYTLGLASEKYTVEAEFVSLSEIGRLVKVNLPAEGGTVEITDANGDSVTLNENNSVYVPVNSKLTFTVKTDAGCKFRAWTDDAEGQSGKSFTMTITKDTEIGVEFDVPVRVGLTYSAASGEQTGAVATKQGYQSGAGIPVGTKITLTAQAAENYRVQKLVITRGGKVDTVTIDDKLYSQYDYELVVDAETDIQVYFTKIEQYTVTVDNPKHADMTIKNGDKDFVSGKTVRYGDEIIVTVKPNENYRLADAASWIDNGDGSYTYKTGAIKADTNISVKIEEIPEYTVTFPTTIDGCILSVKNDKEKISSGDKLREGTRLTATVTLDPTYILKGWYIGGELLSEINKTEVTFTVDGDMLITVIVADVKGDKGDQGDKGDTGDTGVGVKSVVISENGNLIITLTDDTVIDLGKVTGDKGSQGDKGDQGETGATGVGVKSVAIDENGNLVITLTDDTVHNAGKVTGDKGNQGDKGDKGDTGATGVGVKSVTIDENGNLIITLTDDTVYNAGKVTGNNGDKGETGATGVGVKSVAIDENGNLVITLTDDTVHNLGKVTGAKGDKGDQGDKGDKGDKGDAGATGVGVKSVTIDEDGNLIITLTDDTVHNAGKVIGDKGEQGNQGDKGDKGDKGDTGIGVKSVTIDEYGNLIITLTDDTVHNAGKVNASNGENGADGVDIENAVVDENGNLIITLTDGTVYNLGNVTGAKGDKGDAGKDGQDGQNGQDGSNGSNGLNGTGIQSAHIDADGNLIITFTDGVVTNLGKIVGTDGKDGKDGADGKDGIGIKGCRIDDDGNLILTLTDNTTLDAGNISAISDRVSVSKPLATAAVSLSGGSLLWNIVSLVSAIVRKKKLI